MKTHAASDGFPTLPFFTVSHFRRLRMLVQRAESMLSPGPSAMIEDPLLYALNDLSSPVGMVLPRWTTQS